MTEDFYDVLGVSRDASEEEVRRAYREKATEYHPDVSDHPDAEERFKQVKTAHEVLIDEEKRAAYDRMGHEQFVEAEKRGGFDGGAGGPGGPFGGAGGAGGPFGGDGDPFGGGGLGDIFEQMFNQGQGRGGARGSRGRSGRDLRTALTVDLADAYHGLDTEVTIERPETCDECGGSGHPADADARTCPQCDGRGQVTQVQNTPLGELRQTSACPRCEGRGEIYDETCGGCGGDGRTRESATLSVEIPPGIRDGQTVRVEGEGGAGENGGPNGDLLIDVAVRPHPDLDRDGDDLEYECQVSFPQVVFGDTVTVPTVDGEVEFDIESGTQSGETVRLRGKGMPRLQRRGYGDLYVTVQVLTPEDLSEERREALMDFAEAGGDEIDIDDGFIDRLRNSL